MEAFLSLLIFTFPGLVAFFGIQLFGFTPTVRYQGVEILAASAILWIPINIVVIGIYHLLRFIYKFNSYYPIEFPQIQSFTDLNSLSNNFIFILYYTVLSVITGYFLARIISGSLYSYILKRVNDIRVSNNKAPLSKDATVWDTIFSKQEAQVVKITKLFNNDEFEIGEIKNVSRTYEAEKNIVLKNMTLWGKIDEKYTLDVKEVFFDIKAEIKIIIYDSIQCQATLESYRRQMKDEDIEK
ncbi:hypothetical protein [Sporosarcina aquimarina]|uniref:Uncharacterized protein n=1 Tax=Sporosarcina aquimarina TaxID=114975 RepID=A0ABU4G3J0_9BACL|nr:hypothetical protein [Sporosarcina aquimarina]MDW0111526.1 hypothetical protein [Sporosarcina aquimarina]